MAFTSFEPSDAMIRALQARCSAKGASSSVTGTGSHLSVPGVTVSGAGPPLVTMTTTPGIAITASVATTAAVGVAQSNYGAAFRPAADALRPHVSFLDAGGPGAHNAALPPWPPGAPLPASWRPDGALPGSGLGPSAPTRLDPGLRAPLAGPGGGGSSSSSADAGPRGGAGAPGQQLGGAGLLGGSSRSASASELGPGRHAAPGHRVAVAGPASGVEPPERGLGGHGGPVAGGATPLADSAPRSAAGLAGFPGSLGGTPSGATADREGAGGLLPRSGLPPRPPGNAPGAGGGDEPGLQGRRAKLAATYAPSAAVPPLGAADGGSRPSTAGRRAHSANGRTPASSSSSARGGGGGGGSARGSAAGQAFSPRRPVGGSAPSREFVELHGPGDLIGAKLPSAITLGGVPVAADGDLIYLGGGLYAAASSLQPREPAQPQPRRKPRQRALPGRVSVPPRPLGPRSAVRSASAHLVGPQSLGGEAGDVSPCPSRAMSDGQLGVSGRLNSAPEVGGPGPAPAPSGPPVWRPSGVGKLPPAPDPPSLSSQRAAIRAELADGSHSPGATNTAVRAEARAAARREGLGLFGGQGLLAQLRAGEAAAAAALEAAAAGRPTPLAPAPTKAIGPPLFGEMRAAERKAAKDERNRMLLEERAARLAAEAAEEAARKKRLLAPLPPRGMLGSASAPDLQSELMGLQGAAAEDLEKAKLRLACKMELLGLVNGYTKSASKLTSEQTKALLAKLNGGGEASIEGAGEALRPGATHASERVPPEGPGAEAPCSIQERLQQVNRMCSRVFEEEDGEGLDLDL